MNPSPVSVIVESLEAVGVRFRLDGEKIKAKLPEASPPEVRETLETLRPRRSELIALLRQRQEADAGVETIIPAGDMIASHRCRACRGFLFWRSVHGPVVCACCHPPAAPTLVASWMWTNKGPRGLQ